ncbi:hypothetical protein ACQKGI_10045 [Peribacillus muralis]|uniref:hypothetical protein n=1 Tax=Peribacillus muralis TaxID=264697 RepID=UPI00381795B6
MKKRRYPDFLDTVFSYDKRRLLKLLIGKSKLASKVPELASKRAKLASKAPELASKRPKLLSYDSKRGRR